MLQLTPLTFDMPAFTMAFQPVVDVAAMKVFAYEALVRGVSGEGARAVLDRVGEDDLLAFDAACRSRAVEMAASFGLRCGLSLNVSPRAIFDRRYGLHATLRTARRVNWPVRQLIFEITEHERLQDPVRLRRWFAACRNRGVTIAIDDFGAGFNGLNDLLQLRPAMVKLDMGLVRGIDADRARQLLVKGVVDACSAFGCRVVGEGVETEAELAMLSSLGIRLVQGHLLARPEIARLPEIVRTVSIGVNARGGGAAANFHHVQPRHRAGSRSDPHAERPAADRPA